MKQSVKFVLVRTATALLCAAMIVLCALFLRERGKVMYYLSVSAFSLLPVVYCALDGDKHLHASRTVLAVTVLAAVVLVCYVLYVTTGLSERFNDFDALRTFILDSGFWGAAIFIGLTVFQVVVLPIPEAVTILLGVAIYGATWSFVLSVIGTIIGSLISFMLGKVFGRRLCNWMFGEANTEKYARIMGEKGRVAFIIMLLFPAFPDDMLCMIAGITDMSYGYFTLVCLLTRPVMIGLTAYLGSGVIPFEGRGIAIWVAIACLLFVVFVLVNRIKTLIERRAAHDPNTGK